jgi:SAM-dependent methyltransferase
MIRKGVRAFTAGAVRLSMKGLPRGPHITRFFMYRHLAQFRQSPNVATKVLSISHSDRLCEVLGLDPRLVTEANYPAVSMLSLPYPDGSFDYVVSDQVLEHVAGDPQRAIDETFRVLRAGGLAIHATCFMNPIHEAPGDFWRFTPGALRLLCTRFSSVIECGGWGEPICLDRGVARPPARCCAGGALAPVAQARDPQSSGLAYRHMDHCSEMTGMLDSARPRAGHDGLS